ncbi:Peroxidasin [Taenia crassiceps]|uniref:Peroxidasin n=1 Tax=Taenia crassiceps TaxID=6207 RepID=A0ABR4QP88_9CEST
MNVISISALLFAICQLVRSASNCIELMSGNSFGLFCPSFSGSLPPTIPTGKRYSKLQIESASFQYGGAVLSKTNFTGLESLTYLRITSSGIERINPDAFFNLRQLTHLDLSKNRLTFIEPGTFRGLKLRKLILSGNSGLKLPSAALSGAKIFNFVARDCDIHSISFALFKQTEEFSALIMPSDGSWGSVDLSNNSLVCDCALLWLAQLFDKQRRYMGDASSDLIGARSPRYPRETTEEEVFKPMYRLNITCSAPKHLVQQRFPLPGEFDCPAPQVTGIDIAIIGKLMETVQLTCHARGRPTPNVAWAFQQHNQEVHRIVKSPTQLPPWSSDQMMDVSIGLNEEGKNEPDVMEQNKDQPQQQQQQQSAYFGETATTVGSGSGPAYWPVQDYAYSTHEYDVPGMTDPLAGAMPLSPHPMMGMPNATGTLVRRGRPMSTASLHPSAIQTPYLFPKAATSTTGLILPPVATVPPLGVVASPFLSYATVPQPPMPSQQPPVYFGHNHQLSLSALPNGQLVMTPTMSRNLNGAASQQPEEPEACAESSVTSCNSEKSATERLIGASGGLPTTQ